MGNFIHSRIQRLREWHQLGKIQAVFEDPAMTAGREAEQFALELVDTHVRYKNASCYLGKRFPSKEHGRRYEIDLVVLTPNRIYLFEIKNWSGELKAAGGQWIQVRRNGETVRGPNLVDYNQNKVDVIKGFLRSQGIALDRSYFTNRVIFMNPRLQVESAIAENPNVLTRDRLEGYLSAQRGNSLAERFVHSIIETCLDAETGKALNDRLFHAMPSDVFRAIQDLFSTVRTWDKMGLYGGKVLTGDVLKLTLGGRSLDITDFAPGTLLRLSWTRNRIWGLIKALATAFPMGRIRYPDKKEPLSADDSIKFHPAGEEKPIDFSLGCVNWIKKG